jgi:hypothetical protein
VYVKKTIPWAVEVEVEVVCKYRPGTPDVMYLRNGDPGYPGDPAEIEVIEVYCEGEKVTGALAAQIIETLQYESEYEELFAAVEEAVIDDGE